MAAFSKFAVAVVADDLIKADLEATPANVARYARFTPANDLSDRQFGFFVKAVAKEAAAVKQERIDMRKVLGN